LHVTGPELAVHRSSLSIVSMALDAGAVAKLFKQCDTQGAGVIRRDRLYRVFAALDPKLEADRVNLVLAHVGLDAEEIDYTKLVDWCVPSEAPTETAAPVVAVVEAPAETEAIPVPGVEAPAEAEALAVAVVETPAETEAIPAAVVEAPAEAEALAVAVVETPAETEAIPVAVVEAPAEAEALAVAVVETPAKTEALVAGESELETAEASASENILKPAFEVKLKAIFDKMELNGDGTVNKRELIKSLKRDHEVADFLGLPTDIHQEDGSRDAMEKFFQEVDKNGDREMSWEEFKSFFESRATVDSEASVKSLPAEQLAMADVAEVAAA